jgi:hypothetical protein
MLSRASSIADFRCGGGSCSMSSASGWDEGRVPNPTTTSILFIDGDLTVGPGYVGTGMLLVTGTLRIDASASWDGPMIIVGSGRFVRTGTSGSGVLSGAAVLANIAGIDGAYGNADDCQGGTDGFWPAGYHEAIDEEGDTMYCTDDLTPANVLHNYEVTHFRQR